MNGENAKNEAQKVREEIERKRLEVEEALNGNQTQKAVLTNISESSNPEVQNFQSYDAGEDYIRVPRSFLASQNSMNFNRASNYDEGVYSRDQNSELLACQTRTTASTEED